MNDELIHFMWGALAMGSCIAGLFFLRFWRTTRDRFFAFLAAAFWAFAASWCALSVVHPRAEMKHYQYAIRLVGFLLIIAGIIDKNRGRGPER